MVKTMDYEKAYNEAIKRAKAIIEVAEKEEEVYKSAITIFPELYESEDERVRKAILELVRQSSEVLDRQNQNNMIAWLEKQGNLKSDEWKEGDVVRHGGVLALVTNGRRAIKSNLEQITIQYPDEWVKAETKERKYFFDELEKQDKFIENNEDDSDTDFIIYHPLKNGKGRYECIPYSFYGMLSSFSEDKDMIDFLRLCFYTEEECNEWIKQNESTDKVESKFREGDWIVWQNKCYKVNYNGCGYELIDQNGLSTSLEYGTVDTYAHLWDITKDAKDGDVLVASDSSIFIFKEVRGSSCKHYIALTSDNEIQVNTKLDKFWETARGVKPSTKEQRDTLLKAMADAGYTFDFDKKELKKIEPKPADWGEEDESIILGIEQLCNCASLLNIAPDKIDKIRTWLKSLKERIKL